MKDIPNLYECYKDDLPAGISLDIELDMWSHTWTHHELSDELCTPDKVLPPTTFQIFALYCSIL